jgi:hypothetical protein
MAIRDQVLVKTKEGGLHTLEVTKQGGKIDITWPRKTTDFFEARLLDKNDNPLPWDCRLVIPTDQIIAILTRTEKPAVRVPRTRRGGIKATQPSDV